MDFDVDDLPAPYDSLTGFRDRRALFADLADAIAARRECIVALFALDGAETVRKLEGHEVCDRAIAELAEEFSSVVGSEGTCYVPRRHEFALLVMDRSLASQSALLASAGIAIRREGMPRGIGTSFGVTLLPGEASSPLDALIVADRRRRNRIRPAGTAAAAVDR